MPEPIELEVYTGDAITVDPLRRLDGGGTRVEIDVENGPRFRLDVVATGDNYDVVTSWDETGQLADVDVPEWVDDVLHRLHAVA
jgi:hypothetical protein